MRGTDSKFAVGRGGVARQWWSNGVGDAQVHGEEWEALVGKLQK